MKKTKRIISMILTIIMLSMTAIGVNAEELIFGFDDLLEAVGIIEHDHEEELMAMAAEDDCEYRCPPHIYRTSNQYHYGETCGLDWCDAVLYTQLRCCFICGKPDDNDMLESIVWCDNTHNQALLDTYQYGGNG